MPPIKVGVIGYGFAAKSFHLPFINAIPDYEVVAILQRAEKPADPGSVGKGVHCTVDFPHVTHHRTAEDFFANSDIDFVVVASHADTHVSFAEQALRAGKHGVLRMHAQSATANTLESYH
jgi:predicted dehydrogenase